ncbi:MAG TPA: YdcF family protein, partial [Methylothermaceae bacterium]|nr:YdcF family protein [Methylothermaceae bacterium]
LWSWMDIPPPVDPDTAAQGQAIVILGATRYSRAPEYGMRDNLAGLGLERVRYGAWLQKKTGLPILVSGRGYRAPGERSEAQIMRDILENEFGARVTWLEQRSRNTFENGLYSAAILHQSGIDRILLVTHAYHMPRAQAVFEAMGLQVTPAPTIYFNTYEDEFGFLDWLPENRALHRNRLLLHEIVGLIWYRLVYL